MRAASGKLTLIRTGIVFIFDDDIGAAKYLADLVESWFENVTALACTDRAEAVRAVRLPGRYDLVICDACPDEKEEPDIRIIQESKKNNPNTKVIIYSSKEPARKLYNLFIQAGADKVLLSQKEISFNRPLGFIDELRKWTVEYLQKSTERAEIEKAVSYSINVNLNGPGRYHIYFWQILAEFMADFILKVCDEEQKKQLDQNRTEILQRDLAERLHLDQRKGYKSMAGNRQIRELLREIEAMTDNPPVDTLAEIRSKLNHRTSKKQ